MSKNKDIKLFRILLASNLSNIFGFALFLPLYGVYIVKLGQPPEFGSSIWAIHTLLTGLLVLFVGRIEDKLHGGYHKALIGGNILQVAGSMMFLLTDGLTSFVVGLMIYSIGTAILAPSWFSLFSSSIAKKHSAKGWSVSQGLGALAGAMGAAVGGYLFHVGQFEYVFMTLVAFHILGLCFAIRALKM